MTPFTVSTTPTIVFGAGAIARLGSLASGRLGPRVLVVSDAGLVAAGLVAPAIAALEEAGIAVALFTDVVADPPESVVEAAAAAARAHRASGVVGIGGGSSLDVAKLAALLAGSGEPLADAYGVGKAAGPRLPLLLAPTTAGTGSEVTPISIVTTGAHTKMGVVSPLLLPDIALLDPDLTLGLPAPVTAATGVDAMVHAIEAFTSASPNANAVSKALAREALRLLGGAIADACRDGADRAARGAMLLGSMLAGQAFANAPVAAVHALAYPLGGRFGIPHGLSNALVLTQVMRFNLPAAEAAYAALGPCTFTDCPPDAEAFIARLETLCAEIGLARRLRDVGVPEDALDLLADDAMGQTRLLVNNPREVGRADALAIYRAAW
ncbi:MAG: iron-containing alcohol dehydrogenase [Salinarimonas sp.]